MNFDSKIYIGTKKNSLEVMPISMMIFLHINPYAARG